jgi:phenylpropionate dioxygenase-like ring-hydroxylating dioxygenase large terminal subunit
MTEAISHTEQHERITLTERSNLSLSPVPLDPYRTPEFFALERDQVFKRAWLLVGRVEEIPKHGDYVVKRIDPCPVSAILIRGKDERVRAFYNSCSHRGSEVVAGPEGNSKQIICPYHNWSYASEGELVGIPDESSFFAVDKAKCGLTPIAVDVWEGWIFINLQPKPEVTLAAFLGPFAERLAGLPYIAAGSPLVVTADLDANWKVVADAFIESYHIPAIHPKTLADTFASSENRFSRLLDAEVFGPHRTVSMYGNPNVALNPNNKVEVLAYSQSATGSVIAAGASALMEDFLAHPAVNPTRSGSWSMDVNHVFPHSQIDCGPGGFWLHQFWPTSPNTCRYEVHFYVPPASSARERLQQELYVARVVEVVLEDLSNVARTQRGIDTGGKQVMQIQDNEIAIRHSVQQIIKWTQAETVAEALA